MRYFLQISYNGSAYHGWQIQDNAISIQQVLNEKLSVQLGAEIYCVGCGRTDTGVHALKYFLHFDFDSSLNENFIHKINSFLPSDIAVQKVFEADGDANARWSAIERTYKYFVSIGKDPLSLGYAGRLHKQPDIIAMQEAADILLRYTDFEALSKFSPDEQHHLSSITHAQWEQDDYKMTFTITANRFLRGMVRILTGTMFEVGKGKITPAEFEEIIKNKDRSKAFGAAPAEGLYLWDVKYPDGLLCEILSV